MTTPPNELGLQGYSLSVLGVLLLSSNAEAATRGEKATVLQNELLPSVDNDRDILADVLQDLIATPRTITRGAISLSFSVLKQFNWIAAGTCLEYEFSEDFLRWLRQHGF